jgi:hypothetical protein
MLVMAPLCMAHILSNSSDIKSNATTIEEVGTKSQRPSLFLFAQHSPHTHRHFFLRGGLVHGLSVAAAVATVGAVDAAGVLANTSKYEDDEHHEAQNKRECVDSLHY